MLKTEKAQPESHAHSKVVLPDIRDNSASILTLQVSRLTNRCAISVKIAEIIAPIVWGVRS
jgi:hypothetical protein